MSGNTPKPTASIIYEQGWLDGLMAMHDNISGRYTLADVGGLAWNQFRRLLRRDAVAGPPSNPYDSGVLVEGAPTETCVEVPAGAKRIRITGTLASPVVEVLERHTWEGAPTDEQVEREAAERWPALGPNDAELTYSRSVLRAFCRASFREGANFAAAGVAPPAPSEPEHSRHLTVSECWPTSCLEGDCDHRDGYGEPEDLSVCPATPMEVCVDCMVERGVGDDLGRWEDAPLAPWPCKKPGPAPSADRNAWPEHWTKDDKLSDLHAQHHSETGNMLAKDECGSPRCEFWSVASEVFDALAAPAPVHIADEAVQKLRGLGLDDTAIRERLLQATMLAAAPVSDELVQVVVKSAANGAKLPPESAARLLAVADTAVEGSLEWHVVVGKLEGHLRVEDLRNIARWLRGATHG